MTTPDPRDRAVRRVIIIEGAANLLVLSAKLAVGLSAGSLAVLSDAVHSLSDLFNNVVAWFVMRLSAKPADREHPYGHRKFETLAVFALAALLVVLAFELALNAAKGHAKPVASAEWEIAVMLAVLCVNAVVAAWERRWARRLKSEILLADSSHTFADVMITVAVLAGWQLSVRGFPVLDRLCALAVAVLVLRLAYQLFKRAVPVLVDQFAVDPEQLTSAVLSVPGVHEVRRIRSRWVGSVPAVDMIVTVDAALSTEKSHAIGDQVEALINERFGIEDISIHIEPDNRSL